MTHLVADYQSEAMDSHKLPVALVVNSVSLLKSLETIAEGKWNYNLGVKRSEELYHQLATVPLAASQELVATIVELNGRLGVHLDSLSPYNTVLGGRRGHSRANYIEVMEGREPTISRY